MIGNAYPLASNASIFCSALALRRGSVHRLGRIFYGLLHLSERSRTIEVRVTTLSAQNTRKISRPKLLGSVYLIGSFQAFYLGIIICFFASNASISGLMGNGTPRLMSAEETPSCSYRRRGSLMKCVNSSVMGNGRRRHSSLRAPMNKQGACVCKHLAK